MTTRRAPRGLTLEQRILRRVIKGPECWEWDGFHATTGYGRFSIAHGVSKTAHRAVYEILSGPIPDGMELDHLCNNRGCVNPAHLEPKTHLDNTRRGKFAEHGSSLTHCKNGHERTPENQMRRSKPRGPLSECLACHREREARRKAA
jgi:hypothetical protein